MTKNIKKIDIASDTMTKRKVLIKEVLLVAAGSIFLAVMSQAKIDIGVVPITLQTLGVFLLGLSFGPRRAFFSVVLYLIEASCGQPVLAGGVVSPLWFVGPKGGYLVGMPFAAYFIGYMMQRPYKYVLIQSAFALFLGQSVIYVFGLTWLSYYIGFKQAFLVGVAPFFFVMLTKVGLAVCLSKPAQLINKKLK